MSDAINEKYIKGPFKANKAGGYILGPNNFVFAHVRGWGELGYLKNGAEIQDANLEHMKLVLNCHFKLVEALEGLVNAFSGTDGDVTQIERARDVLAKVKDGSCTS